MRATRANADLASPPDTTLEPARRRRRSARRLKVSRGAPQVLDGEPPQTWRERGGGPSRGRWRFSTGDAGDRAREGAVEGSSSRGRGGGRRVLGRRRRRSPADDAAITRTRRSYRHRLRARNGTTRGTGSSARFFATIGHIAPGEGSSPATTGRRGAIALAASPLHAPYGAPAAWIS